MGQVQEECFALVSFGKYILLHAHPSREKTHRAVAAWGTSGLATEDARRYPDVWLSKEERWTHEDYVNFVYLYLVSKDTQMSLETPHA